MITQVSAQIDKITAKKKPIPPSRLGSKATDETKLKMRLSHLGQNTWSKGSKKSKETKEKMSIAKKGKKPNSHGKKQSIETIEKRVSHFKGKNHWNWKNGVSTENQKIRHSREMRLWREAVFERDNFVCIWCGQIGGKLEADHIKPFSLFPELRFAIDNGRTLCRECHKTTDTYMVKSRWKKI